MFYTHNCKYRLGQVVTVVKKFPTGERMPNSDLDWVEQMDDAVGNSYEIIDIRSYYGYRLRHKEKKYDCCWFCEESLALSNEHRQMMFSFMHD